MPSWFSRLFRKPLQLNDADFGALVYMGGYWEGAGRFPPTQSDVEYFVMADERGPSNKNRAAFSEICGNYQALHDRGLDAVRAATRSDLITMIVVSSMDVPSEDISTARWEMNFSGVDGVFYSVEYKGLHATGLVEVSR
ncbi:hypothetical protein [Pseudoxanthomonas mexicana]